MKDLKAGDIIICNDMDTDIYAREVIRIFRYHCHLIFVRTNIHSDYIATWNKQQVLDCHSLLYRKGDEDA